MQDMPTIPKFLELSGDALTKAIKYLEQTYAYIEIKIENELFQYQDEPIIHQAQPTLEDPAALEYVYDIHDYGDRLMAVKQDGKNLYNQNMLKMYFTIEKMIAIWTDKIQQINAKENSSENDWIFLVEGHEFCKRKVFEVVINHPDNWIIINYDPGIWGNSYLKSLKILNEKNFPYPGAAPRDIYRHKIGQSLLETKLGI